MPIRVYKMTKITLKPQAYQSEVDKYGIEGLKKLWTDILERYAHEEYYDPYIVEKLLKSQEEE